MNYLIVLNDFVGLALKGLKSQKYFIIASFYGIRTKDQKNITASIIPTLNYYIRMSVPVGNNHLSNPYSSENYCLVAFLKHSQILLTWSC